jgi:hypothetical protein
MGGFFLKKKKKKKSGSFTLLILRSSSNNRYFEKVFFGEKKGHNIDDKKYEISHIWKVYRIFTFNPILMHFLLN